MSGYAVTQKQLYQEQSHKLMLMRLCGTCSVCAVCVA